MLFNFAHCSIFSMGRNPARTLSDRSFREYAVSSAQSMIWHSMDLNASRVFPGVSSIGKSFPPILQSRKRCWES